MMPYPDNFRTEFLYGPFKHRDPHRAIAIDHAMDNLTILKAASAAFLASVRDVPPGTGVGGYELADAVQILTAFATADLDAERKAMEDNNE